MAEPPEHLPVIDVSPLLGRDERARARTAEEIGAACRSLGFFYATGHSIAPTILDQLDGASRTFFALPESRSAETAAQAEQFRAVALVEVDYASGTLYLHSGAGTITWNGHDYMGAGALGKIEPIEEAAELQSAGVTLSLSGVDAANIAATLAERGERIGVGADVATAE